ncbi:MAG: hypothetical protein J6P20_05730 [Oscillospiraceae bacterium]|nr:hypothetical protein [Oscillospiraceae bacterium]
MTDLLSGAVMEALRADGIPALPEYPLRPVPAVPFYVTAACAETVYGAPLESFFGDALPFTMTLRLRYHCKPDADFAAHADRTDACIIRTMQQKHADLRSMKNGALHYDRQLGVCIRETLLQISGTLYLTEEESV